MAVEPQRRPDVRAPLEALLGVPFTEGNQVRVLRNGDETFPAMLAAIRGATRSVDLLTFIWNAGAITRTFTEALCERARAGVRVRVLLDAFGSQHIARAQLRALRAAGCDVAFYRPLLSWRPATVNRRTHERALICDEEVAFTGGHGIHHTWCGDAQDPRHYRDTAVRVRGPAVAGLRAAFLRNWLQTNEPVCGSADRFPPGERAGDAAVQVVRSMSAPGWNEAAMAVHGLLHVARDRVRIATPYVRLAAPFPDLLAGTVARGVSVQMVLTGPHPDRRIVQLQSQRQWQRLLDAGVDVRRYQPTLMHCKAATVDGRLAMVGTANLDLRSLTLNQQVNLLVDDPVCAAELDAHLDDDLARSEPLDPARWAARGLRQRAAEVAADVVGMPLRGSGAAGLTSGRPWPVTPRRR